MSVTLDKLRYFVVLAEELSFTRAAARVFMTQQAFSAHIGQLEAWIGAPLFERTTREVSLTAAGRRLIGPVKEALRLLDDGLDEVRMLSDERRRLRLGLPPGGAGALTAAVLEEFRAGSPTTNLDMREAPFDDPTSGLRDRLVDVALVRLPVNTSGLVLEVLFSEPIFLAVSKKHPLAETASVTLEQALAEPLVLMEGGTPEWDDFWFLNAQRGGRPQAAAFVRGSHVEEIEAVAAGIASTFMPASVANRYLRHAGVRFLTIDGAPVSTVGMAWREEALTPLAGLFVDAMHRVVEKQPELMAALSAGRQAD